MKAITLGLMLLSSVAFGAQVELLRDPDMMNGLQYSHGTINGAEAEQCRKQFAGNLPGGMRPEWSFVEVCEDTCFCHNPDSPEMVGNELIYEGLGKSVIVDRSDAEITIDQDTSFEHNDGCSLRKTVNGVAPDYDHEWDWNHILLTQRTNIPLNKHESMTFSGEVAIEHSEKTGRSCKPDQALIYYALQLSPIATKQDLPRLFAAVRLWQTWDGENPAGSEVPFIGADPGGNTVYISPVVPNLGTRVVQKQGEEFHRFTIDAKRLSREALKAHFQATGQFLREQDYRISVVILGNETWGGYNTTTTFRDISLTGEDMMEQYVGFYSYNHDGINNHFHGKYFNPAGFNGYDYEGQMGVTPTKEVQGMVPLYMYYSRTVRDHFYTRGLWPLGAGGKTPCGQGDRFRVPGGYCGDWQYAGVAAYVWPTPGPNRLPVYEMWNPTVKDHKLTLVQAEGIEDGYRCMPDCDTPRFYIDQ